MVSVLSPDYDFKGFDNQATPAKKAVTHRRTNMEKLTGAIWDKMGKDARKELLKKTGSFPGNVGKDWDELTDGAKARLTGAPVEAEAKTKPEKKSPTVSKAAADIEHAKKVLSKPKTKEVKLDNGLVNDVRRKLTKEDRTKGLLFGMWPETAKHQLAGLYFVAIPTTGEIVKPDCQSQNEAVAYVNAILSK